MINLSRCWERLKEKSSYSVLWLDGKYTLSYICIGKSTSEVFDYILYIVFYTHLKWNMITLLV